ARRLAALAERRDRGGEPLPAHALLVLPGGGMALLARGRRHLLRPNRRAPQARARAWGLHLRAPIRSRTGAGVVRRDRRAALDRRSARAAAPRALPEAHRRRPVARRRRRRRAR